MAVLFCGTAALGLTTGSTTTGIGMLVLGTVFVTWLTWCNSRFDRRRTQMRRRVRRQRPKQGVRGEHQALNRLPTGAVADH
ncbi:putative protein OS=Streptomyces fumanus OX=67302 GN=GCM10018772_40390 PE=4 SV=1 [Streptomyces fumanus]